jgi:mannose/cellobiose epimerase-like protein (N-acyl-D-glucosamine 2-epimerase family)
MKFDAKASDLAVQYFYTDLFVMLAFSCGVMQRRHKGRQDAVRECVKDLEKGLGNEESAVPKALMLQAKGPDELLALIGLHSNSNFMWKYNILLIANHTRPYTSPEIPLPMPLEGLKANTLLQIQDLVVDDDLEQPANGGFA